MSKYYCGPTYLPGVVKKAMSINFNTACKYHDSAYASGIIPRKKIDQMFLQDMLNLSSNFLERGQAYLYYFMVRIFGRSRYTKK